MSKALLISHLFYWCTSALKSLSFLSAISNPGNDLAIRLPTPGHNTTQNRYALLLAATLKLLGPFRNVTTLKHHRAPNY